MKPEWRALDKYALIWVNLNWPVIRLLHRLGWRWAWERAHVQPLTARSAQKQARRRVKIDRSVSPDS